MWTEEEPIPISLVMNTVFCERRAWLEAMGETVAHIAIEDGIANHARTDSKTDDRTAKRKAVAISHPDLGITGRCDVLNLDDRQRHVQIVEFKATPLRRRSEVTRPQIVQLALQRLCLEEAGYTVLGQSIYFTTQRTTVPVTLTDADTAEAIAFIDTTRQVVTAPTAPPPLVADPRCTGCTHVSICLPDERDGTEVRRRVQVPDPHGEVLHVATPGARVSIRQGRLTITTQEESQTLPIERVDALVVHGNVDVSSAALRELLWRDCMVLWCSWRGRLVGYAKPAHGPNGLVRARQHASTAADHLALAHELIAAKITNQATQLRRNTRHPRPDAIKRLRALSRLTTEAKSLPTLLGIEGDAAAIYFRFFRDMMSTTIDPRVIAGWAGREGRGAGDAVNVALNFVYGLLLGDVVRAVVASGLDPHVGFVHSSSRNKPALALDLMEQFRPVVADSVVLAALNNEQLRVSMFSQVLGDVRLRDEGRRALITVYERRVSTQITHPVFGYRLTWRRAMEVQARMLLGVLDGTQPRYIGIRVR